jgi:lipoate-protein ligase A
VPSNYEITVAGKKIIGSAQARRLGGVLQHGTLPLSGDLTRITRALRYTNQEDRDAAARRLLERATTVEQLLGRSVPWSEAASAMAGAFQHILNLSLEKTELTPAEQVRAEELKTGKYGRPE